MLSVENALFLMYENVFQCLCMSKMPGPCHKCPFTVLVNIGGGGVKYTAGVENAPFSTPTVHFQAQQDAFNSNSPFQYQKYPGAFPLGRSSSGK